MAPRTPFHPSDEALLAIAASDDAGASRAERKHVRTCETCGERIVELRRVRALLHDVAGEEAAPRRDLVRGAVRRLTYRRRSIANVNELFGALRAMFRGFSSLLSIDDQGNAPRG